MQVLPHSAWILPCAALPQSVAGGETSQSPAESGGVAGAEK